MQKHSTSCFYSVMPKYGSRGQSYFEQKPSADEREVYEGTPSEETTVE